MRRVIIESPYAGDVEGNSTYARAALRDSLIRGEVPFASHLLYTQALDDTDPAERELGIRAGLEWATTAHATIVYHDLGISAGMQQGIEAATAVGRPIEYRTLKENP
ncbi:hypothetical protein [Mycetocola saprophilus]|uniref:DUF7768 domain-containing protein n=1 Tax=Mycetocola saprophilus TaxID=76636 RepID=UPI0004C1A064|nr:hypothetical protein [Mycetocola saprophilus]